MKQIEINGEMFEYNCMWSNGDSDFYYRIDNEGWILVSEVIPHDSVIVPAHIDRIAPLAYWSLPTIAEPTAGV